MRKVVRVNPNFFILRLVKNIIPAAEYPSCLQTTVASDMSKESSQTVPHTLLAHTSTRPSLILLPPISLMLPSAQAVEVLNKFLTYKKYV